MNKVNNLKQKDKEGQFIPITKKVVTKLMKTGNYIPRRDAAGNSNLNDSKSIEWRYRFACKYMDLIGDDESDIYFLGEFSFANNSSLSCCSPLKYNEVIKGKEYFNDNRVK